MEAILCIRIATALTVEKAAGMVETPKWRSVKSRCSNDHELVDIGDDAFEALHDCNNLQSLAVDLAIPCSTLAPRVRLDAKLVICEDR